MSTPGVAVVETSTIVTVATPSGGVSAVEAPTIVTVESQTDTVVVAETATIVTVAAPGPQGPPGPAGAVGGAPFTYIRDTPAATWPISHGLGRYPQVTIVDPLGNRRISDVVYADINNVSVIHSEPLVGAAYLS
jgi:hypothetical protein